MELSTFFLSAPLFSQVHCTAFIIFSRWQIPPSLSSLSSLSPQFIIVLFRDAAAGNILIARPPPLVRARIFISKSLSLASLRRNIYGAGRFLSASSSFVRSPVSLSLYPGTVGFLLVDSCMEIAVGEVPSFLHPLSRVVVVVPRRDK